MKYIYRVELYSNDLFDGYASRNFDNLEEATEEYLDKVKRNNRS
jgi:hypothetical protein